jgi:hypothetical protein
MSKIRALEKQAPNDAPLEAAESKARVPEGKPLDPRWVMAKLVIGNLKTEILAAAAEGRLAPVPAEDLERGGGQPWQLRSFSMHRFDLPKAGKDARFGYFTTLEMAHAPLLVAHVPSDPAQPVAWSIVQHG